VGQGESGTMKNGVRETGSVLQKEKKMRVDEGTARDGGIRPGGEKWRAGTHKEEDRVPSRPGLGRCAVRARGPGRAVRPGAAGLALQGDLILWASQGCQVTVLQQWWWAARRLPGELAGSNRLASNLEQWAPM
jgi:hypothetical protein